MRATYASLKWEAEKNDIGGERLFLLRLVRLKQNVQTDMGLWPSSLANVVA